MKNLKRLMSVVLSVVMLLSFVIGTSAATFTDVAETDNSFQAIEVLAALKILEGKEAGVFDPEANIKRSEFATVICRAMNQSPVGVATFSDVPEDHWAYDYIAWAASQGIVKGKGEGKFDPDANVTYNEAITMIVRAMGYEYYVEEYLNGFPTGYTRIAGSYKMDAGVNVANGNAAATRADVAQLVYNAFDAPLMDYSYAIGSRDTEYVIYNGSKNVDYEKRTLLSYYSDIYKVKATVDNTFKNSTTLTDARGNKMMDLTIQSLYGFDEEWVADALGKTKNAWTAEAVLGATTNTALNKVIANNDAWANYQGYTVDAYVTLNDNNKLEIVAMVPVTAAGTELVIENAKEVINVADVTGSTVSFEYEDENGKDRTPDIAATATIFVNNMLIGDLSGAGYAADAETEFEALASGAYPSVTLLDSDDDGVYDKIYMVAYIYGIVEEVDVDYEVITTTDGAAYELSEDDTQDGFVYTIYKDGAEIAISDLVAGDLLNIVIGDDNIAAPDVADATFVDIYVTNNTIESSVSSVAGNGTTVPYKYIIDGEEYYTAATAMCGDLDPADTGIFYITIDGYIYDVDFTSTYSDNYGFILETGMNAGAFGNVWQIKILDKTNTVRVIPVKSTSLFTSTDGGNTKNQFKDAALDAEMTRISNLFTNTHEVADAGTTAATLATDKAAAISAISANLSDRLVTFKEVNGEITELVFAYGTGVRDYNVASLSGAYSAKTGRLAGKELLDSTVLFNIPFDRAVEKSDIVVSGTPKDLYTLNIDLVQVYAQAGLVTGDSYNGYVYNVDSNNAIGAAVLTDDMGFAGDANALAVITSVSTGLDAAGNSATVLTFIQAGETKSLAISDTYVGDAALASATAGDVFQYTENAAGEIGNATVIYDFETMTILEAGDIDDIAYVAGLVTENTGKVVGLVDSNGADTYAWDLEDGCTNVLFNVARAGKANAFNAKSGTSYIRAYKVDGSNNFTTDAYVAVVRMDEGVIVDVVAYLYAEEYLTAAAQDAIDTDTEFIAAIND